MAAWLVVLYVFGVGDEVERDLEVLAELVPTVRETTGSIVFITLNVTAPEADAAARHAKAEVEKVLRRSAMIQCVVEGP
jgi:hypothetical protein